MAVLAPVLLPLTAAAQVQQDRIPFDIPSQPLSDALDQYSRQAGRQILLPYEAAVSLRSPRVRGRLTPREALERLLAGSPLEIADMTPQAVTVRRHRTMAADTGRALPDNTREKKQGFESASQFGWTGNASASSKAKGKT